MRLQFTHTEFFGILDLVGGTAFGQDSVPPARVLIETTMREIELELNAAREQGNSLESASAEEIFRVRPAAGIAKTCCTL